jgi:ribose-phosphate pyrophosphokinase
LDGSLKIFSTRASTYLASEVCVALGLEPGQAEIMKFRNDNTFVRILENVRDADVFVIATSTPPVDENLMETLIIIDALKRASAGRVTAVLPYFPYAKSDKKDQPRVPITARLVADLLTAAGADRIITFDLHSSQIQGFFSIPLDHLTALPMLADHFVAMGLVDPVVIATDAGGAKRATDFALRLDAPVALLDKRRIGNEQRVKIRNIIGEVANRPCLIFDDEVETGGTLIAAAELLRDRGASAVHVACGHAVLAGEAPQRLGGFPFASFVVTNTVPVPPERRFPGLTVLSVAPLLSAVIDRIHRGESISSLLR